jgi:AAA15 family ATPase/GTPase
MGNYIILPKTFILGDGDNSMKIEKMIIDNINGIKHLDLNFNKGLNLICGENGVGKTTILKAIAHQFLYGNDHFIKKYYNSETGTVEIWLYGKEQPFRYEITKFVPGDVHYSSGQLEESNHLMFFSSSRTIDYTKIEALPASKNVKNTNNGLYSANSLISGVDKNIKSWFVNRYVFSNIQYSLSISEQHNFELSKKTFNLVDNKLSVKTVKTDYEIVLNSNNNEIYFEMLSDGYKSCIYILLGIIKEIEYRFPEIDAIDFNGIIMIDEIDIHLHPQWQAKLVKVLKETFPNSQIIATTHSPSVLQNATAEEIIPLYKDENGDVHIKELHLGEYGLQGWTLEEIMKDVMGMESTTSDLYAQTIKEFDNEMYEENAPLIKEKYETLCKMLHPKSTLRQLLKIQMAGMEE